MSMGTSATARIRNFLLNIAPKPRLYVVLEKDTKYEFACKIRSGKPVKTFDQHQLRILLFEQFCARTWQR